MNEGSTPGDISLRQPIPVTTYRLQLQPAFTFADARRILAYLARLGITHVYSSPFFRAKPGSTHGYDVCDFGQLNPELGGEPEFDLFANELNSRGLGLLLDFVPNHMAVEPVLNPWWRDMLENGPASPYAKFFDVDWNPVKAELKGKILLPFLGDHYGKVLENGELELVFDRGELAVKYGDLTRPIDPLSYSKVLREGIDGLRAELGDDDFHLQKFLSILTALDNLPTTNEAVPERIADRVRESRVAKDRLSRLADASPRIRKHIDDSLTRLKGTPGSPESFDALHALLEAQPYRLAYWKTAVHEINFRRFFDIDQLAGLRVEEPATFEAMHRLVLKLIQEDRVHGLRLDHVDGLFDPAGYLEQLQNSAHAPDAPSPDKPLYVVVEKILTGNESLPEWPAEGTTGYEFMNDVSRLLVHPRNAVAIRRNYQDFTGLTDSFPEVVYDCKKLITWTSLASELNVLAHALNRLSESDRRSRDFTLDSLRQALREVAVAFPVYRTYVDPAGVSDADRQVVDQAILRARRRNPATEASVFDFVRSTLLPDREDVPEAVYNARLRFAMKFQQYTGPLQAKGIEDTAFYRYNALVSLNEVGGDPQRFGGTIAQFHQANQHRQEKSPRGLIATATHDTKRGEDARCRLHVISEVPITWNKRVRVWSEINADCRTEVESTPAPDHNDEYLFYQALVGSWPVGITEPSAPQELIDRLRAYMQKATKEAKVHTSWITPNDEYDRAVSRFVEESLSGPRSREFLTEFLPFQRRVAQAGMVNSLSQLVLKLASPGVPDFYQGSELWELSLVDPDNRRPVDYEQRGAMLDELEPWLDDENPRGPDDQSTAVADWLENWQNGLIKLFVTASGLRLRRNLPDLFLQGEYLPIEVEGKHAEHVVAFARRTEAQCIIAIVPRLGVSLAGPKLTLPLGEKIWGDTSLHVPAEMASTRFRNLFTRQRVSVTSEGDVCELRIADALGVCPVALLVAES